jgi:hypothetical protein
MRGWQGTGQLLTHERVRVCARAADLVLLWPAVTNTCSSTTSRLCHQAYDHSSPLLLTAPLRSCEWHSLLAAPSSLPRFAAPTSSSPRRPSSPLPPARANLALPGSSAGPRRPRPPPPARAGPRRPSSLLSPCHVPRAHAHSCQRTRASELTMYCFCLQ